MKTSFSINNSEVIDNRPFSVELKMRVCILCKSSFHWMSKETVAGRFSSFAFGKLCTVICKYLTFDTVKRWCNFHICLPLIRIRFSAAELDGDGSTGGTRTCYKRTQWQGRRRRAREGGVLIAAKRLNITNGSLAAASSHFCKHNDPKAVAPARQRPSEPGDTSSTRPAAPAEDKQQQQQQLSFTCWSLTLSSSTARQNKTKTGSRFVFRISRSFVMYLSTHFFSS